jgi:hypothetical protein
VKDLAGILHQKGRTGEAVRLLEANKHLFTGEEEAKFVNLLESLQKQVVPSGNSLNRTLKIGKL